MAIDKVNELLKAVMTDPDAQAKLQDLTRPTDEEGIIRYYAEAAKLLGSDVTEADVREVITGFPMEHQTGTGAAADRIKMMPDDSLDQVAGGYLLYAKGMRDSDSRNPWEVIDDKTGDVIARFETYYEARTYATCPWINQKTDVIDVQTLADLRRRR